MSAEMRAWSHASLSRSPSSGAEDEIIVEEAFYQKPSSPSSVHIGFQSPPSPPPAAHPAPHVHPATAHIFVGNPPEIRRRSHERTRKRSSGHSRKKSPERQSWIGRAFTWPFSLSAPSDRYKKDSPLSTWHEHNPPEKRGSHTTEWRHSNSPDRIVEIREEEFRPAEREATRRSATRPPESAGVETDYRTMERDIRPEREEWRSARREAERQSQQHAEKEMREAARRYPREHMASEAGPTFEYGPPERHSERRSERRSSTGGHSRRRESRESRRRTYEDEFEERERSHHRERVRREY